MSDVSVIIPAYNQEHRLKRAVESVLCQRLRPLEIIVVDDGSIDGTRQLVQDVSRRSAVPVIYQYQFNQGPAAARNKAIKLASGTFMAFLDADDEWHKDKLSLQHAALQSAPSFLISHTKERWLKNGRHLNQRAIHIPQHGDIFQQSLKLCCVGMSTVMARKTLFERYGLFDESLRCCEDYDLWLRISSFEPFLLVDKRLTIKHGGRKDQVSTRYRVGMDRFRIQALAKLIDTMPAESEKRSAACAELIRRCTIYSKGCRKYGKDPEAAYYRQLAHHFSKSNKNKR